MCESKVTVKYLHCRDKVLVWVWPALSFIGLVKNIFEKYFDIHIHMNF